MVSRARRGPGDKTGASFLFSFIVSVQGTDEIKYSTDVADFCSISKGQFAEMRQVFPFLRL